MPTARWAFFLEARVFKTLRQLFGNNAPSAPTGQSGHADVPGRAAASAGATTPASTQAGFLRRQPVFDRRGRPFGHLLGFHSPQPESVPALLDLLARETAGESAGTLFVPVPLASLWSSTVDRLQGRKIVLLVDLLDGIASDVLSARIVELQAAGLALGFFRRPEHPAFAAAMALADYAVVDCAATDPDAVRNFSAAVRAGGRPVRLLACCIDTPDDHRFCHQWHYELFQGDFARVAPAMARDAADPHKVHLLHLMRLVAGDADNETLAAAMKQDPLLSFRILRYLNSPLIGLDHPIDSLNHALTIMGRQRLSRWLAVLLFSVREPDFGDWLLVESALVRARLMETLGDDRLAGSDERFLTGLFSCLERLLRRPLADLLGELPVSPKVRSALLEHKGALAALLAVAETADSYDAERIGEAAKAAGLAPDTVNRALLGATAWASDVTGHWE